MQTQLSAYEQLEQLYQNKEAQIFDYQSATSNQIILFSCQCSDQDKSFIQYLTDPIQTFIATVDVPKPKLDYHKKFYSQEVSQMFSQNSEINVYSFMHSNQTISVSYLEYFESFAITYKAYTIIVKNEQDVKNWNPPQPDRFQLVVFTFFEILRRFSDRALLNFKKDLSNRSLIGVCCYKSLQWLGIVEHYGSEKLLAPEIVRNFLQKYNLEFVFVKCYQDVNQNSLQQIYEEIKNQYIFDFNDMNIGSTLYFWNSKQFLGCDFINHKHYEILKIVKTMLNQRRKTASPFVFLSEFDLQSFEIDFYKKYINYILSENVPEFTFSTLTSIIFNKILIAQEKQFYKFEIRYPLSFCIKPTSIVIIPIGFNHLEFGFKSFFQCLEQRFFFVQKIESPQQINNTYQIYYFDRCYCLDQCYKLIDLLKKKKNIIIVSLLHESNKQQYELQNGTFLPFSFDYISHSLIESSKSQNSFEDTIKILTSFKNCDLKQLPLNEILYISIFPEDQKQTNNNVYCQKQDLQEIIFNKDLNIEQMRNEIQKLRSNKNQYQDKIFQQQEQYLKKQCQKLIQNIESQLKVFLENPKLSKSYNIITIQKYKPQVIKQKSSQYIITEDSWKEIEDYVLDSLELVKLKFRQNQIIAQTIQDLNDQFLNQGQEIYKKNLIPVNLNIKNTKLFSTKMQVVVIVLNALIIMIPQNSNLSNGIVIYTKQLESSCKQDILNILKEFIDKIKQENINERSILNQQFNLNNQEWNAFIVKFSSTEINFKILQQE